MKTWSRDMRYAIDTKAKSKAPYRGTIAFRTLGESQEIYVGFRWPIVSSNAGIGAKVAESFIFLE